MLVRAVRLVAPNACGPTWDSGSRAPRVVYARSRTTFKQIWPKLYPYKDLEVNVKRRRDAAAACAAMVASAGSADIDSY